MCLNVVNVIPFWAMTSAGINVVNVSAKTH